MGSITDANAVLTLSIPLIYPQPVQIQGFAADDIFDIPAIQSVETMMGVDGILTAGFVNVVTPFTITLMADSLSGQVFDNIFAYQKQNNTVLQLSGSVVLPDLAQRWTMPLGFLRSYTPQPAAKKVLQPRKFVIHWQSMQISQIGPIGGL